MDFSHQRVLEGAMFEAVRARSPLLGKQIINTGSFSVLFEGETAASVHRLSSDNATHDFAAKARQLGLPGVVGVLADYGAVALYDESDYGAEYLWLAHLERLESLQDYPAQRAAVAHLLVHLTDCDDGDLLGTQADKCNLLTKLNDAPVEPYTQQAVEAMKRLLPEYIRNTDVAIDLEISNFMVRASTGDVVLSDPLSGLADVSQAHHQRLLDEVIVIADTLG
ncbi:hypothetical protein V0R53_18430 [Pseudomonas sp. 120P]|uniref:Aminoglycoside phosphotransferase domain-containing protein n=2 Tax=Pseudomonas TaxID=286 RepID=A0AB35WZC0_9PSED|nr:hypothetical protein [Pseudomonas sp. 120P]